MNKTTHIYAYVSYGWDSDPVRTWVKSVSHSAQRFGNLIEDAIKYHQAFGQVDVVEEVEQ